MKTGTLGNWLQRDRSSCYKAVSKLGQLTCQAEILRFNVEVTQVGKSLNFGGRDVPRYLRYTPPHFPLGTDSSPQTETTSNRLRAATRHTVKSSSHVSCWASSRTTEYPRKSWNTFCHLASSSPSANDLPSDFAELGFTHGVEEGGRTGRMGAFGSGFGALTGCTLSGLGGPSLLAPAFVSEAGAGGGSLGLV